MPLPAPVLAALRDYFEVRFGDRRVPLGAPRLPLFATLPRPPRERQPLAAGAINQLVSDAFRAAALEVEIVQPEVAAELRQASAHWLRHTFATHAVKYDGVRLEVLQKLLGHAAITTTAGNYVDEDREMRAAVARAVAERART